MVYKIFEKGMSKFWSLNIGIVAFLIGVFLASFGLWGVLFLISAAIILVMLFGHEFFKRYFKNYRWKYFLIAILGLGFGYLRFVFAVPGFNVGDIAYYRDLNLKAKFEGTIVNEIEQHGDKQYLTIEASSIFWNNNWRKVSGKILVKTDRYPEFKFGDFLLIEGQIRSPPILEGSFYPQQLAKENIFAVTYNPQINFLKVGEADPFWKLVFILKTWLSSQINLIYTEPEASLVAGLLMGIRTSIPQSILDDFSIAGLTHILAISGYNINLMIAIFGFLFVGVGRRAKFLGMLGGIVLFMLFTGFSGSVIRAAWMGFFVILSTANGRKGHALINLLLSAFLMVFLNPYVLAFDLSFELSFLATLGLVVLMPMVEEYLESQKNQESFRNGAIKFYSELPGFLKDGFMVTMAAQVFTTPLIIYYFGRFSIIAPIANIIFLPLIPLIMLVSFLGLMMSYISQILALPLVATTWILLKILLIGVHLIAIIPWAAVQF